MDRKKLLFSLAAVVLVAAVVVAVPLLKNGNGGSTADDGESGHSGDIVLESPENTVVQLANWDGTWNALITYLDKEELSAVREAVKSKEGNDFAGKLATDMVSFRLNGTALTSYSLPQEPGGVPAGDVLFDYTYASAGTAKDDSGTVWYLFETGTDTDYKFIIFTPMEEGVIRSFRFRYGDAGFAELLARNDWAPVMVDSETTAEMLLQAFR